VQKAVARIRTGDQKEYRLERKIVFEVDFLFLLGFFLFGDTVHRISIDINCTIWSRRTRVLARAASDAEFLLDLWQS